MNERARRDLQAAMLIGEHVAQMIDMGIQGCQDQRHALAVQESKGVAALSHDTVEKLDITDMRVKLGIEIHVSDQSQKIVPATQHGSPLNGAEAAAPPALEWYVDTFSASAFGFTAENARLRKLIEGIYHLPQKFALSALSGNCVGGVTDGRNWRVYQRGFRNSGALT
jgi:hypothetical protein